MNKSYKNKSFYYCIETLSACNNFEIFNQHVVLNLVLLKLIKHFQT